MNNPPRRPTLSDQAYRAIKRRIICLAMPPGMPFTEAQLAAELGLSKTPVREALSWLQRDGLVDVEARSGYAVAPVTIKDVRDLFALRVILEGEAVALAACRKLSSQHLAILEPLSSAGYDPNDHETISDFLSVNSQFHATIARLGGNGRLAAALEQVLQQMERLFHLSLAAILRVDVSATNHHGLIAAIESGDPAGARALATANTLASERMVIESLLSSDAILFANIAEVPHTYPTPSGAAHEDGAGRGPAGTRAGLKSEGVRVEHA
ncbi:MAG TPA: GntR family transcriptional regulator [Chloroflexota bacterium]|nr:GntR family transcriptional regulator [Chloroflexota bacterium]